MEVLRRLPGVAEARQKTEGRLVLQMSGALGPALRMLADAGPSTLAVREPSLEEIFLDFYGERA